ncbi:MAG: phage major capsid protein [Treponema sp.]|jgi:HK97 family phage major capsid protein|nr:phage major capsid protein [Treponema sp.]
MNELLRAIKQKLADMKKIENTGFSDQAKAAEYFQDKEILLEEMAKALETVATTSTEQVEQLEKTVKSLREELKGQAANPRELTQKELYYKLGRGIAAVSRGSKSILAELGYTPTTGTENWTNPKDVNWVMGKGWITQRATAGDPMGDMSTADHFLIHPAYETELVGIAEKNSVMMPLVDSVPMTTASVIVPIEEDVDVNFEWLTPYGEEIPEVEQPKIEKVEIKALTCAGYVRFYDEFEEDSFIDLGKLFVKKFIGSYAKEFDKQCLVANNAPFTGALRTNRAINYTIKGNTIKDLTWEDFNNAVYKVPAEERKNCCWFLHETIVNHVCNLKDANGNPIVRRPMEKMPGVIDLYPYHECHVMPQFSDIGANTPLAVFVNPQRISHRNRKGIELKRFDGTSESLKFGTKALRFRKRDGFELVIPKNHMVVLKTKSS